MLFCSSVFVVVNESLEFLNLLLFSPFLSGDPTCLFYSVNNCWTAYICMTLNLFFVT